MASLLGRKVMVSMTLEPVVCFMAWPCITSVLPLLMFESISTRMALSSIDP